jgi:O-antigen/teichoic acid export membrane protein
MTSIAKNTFYSSITFGLRFVSNALLSIVIARVLGASEFGHFAFAISFTGIFLVIVDYGFNVLIVKDVAVSPEKAIPLCRDILSGKWILTALSTVIIVGTVKASGYPAETAYVIYILWLSSVLYSFGLFYNNIFRGFNLFQYETYPTVILNVVQILLVGILILFHCKAIAIACGYFVARAVYLSVSVLFVSKKIGRLGFGLNLRRGFSLLLQAMPFGVHAILGTLFFQLDTVLLSHYSGNTEVGYYQAAMRLVLASLIICDVLTSAYFPHLSKKIKVDLYAFKDDGLALNKYLLMIGGMISSFLIVYAKEVVTIVYGGAYSRSIYLMQLLAAVILLKFIGSAYSVMVTVSEHQNLRAFGVAVSVVVNVILNLMLIPGYGAVGAAMTSIITHIVLDSLYLFFVVNLVKDSFVDRNIVTTVVLLTAGCLAANFLKPFSVPFSVVTFGLFSLALPLLAFNAREKRAVKDALKKVKPSLVRVLGT